MAKQTNDRDLPEVDPGLKKTIFELAANLKSKGWTDRRINRHIEKKFNIKIN
jgi:hypothetical protein